MKVLTDREIIEQAKVEAFEAMKEMLEGKRVTYEAHLLSPYMIIDIFDSLNMEYNDDFETNGWQLDYWFGGFLWLFFNSGEGEPTHLHVLHWVVALNLGVVHVLIYVLQAHYGQ